MNGQESIRELLDAGPACLTPEELARLAALDMPAADRAPLEDHLASCSRCSAERAMLESFESAVESAGERAPLAAITTELERRRAARWPAAPARKWSLALRWLSLPTMNTWALVAASLLMVVAGSFYLESLRQPGLSPGTGERQVLRSLRVEAVSPSGELSRPPQQFEWTTFEGAERYRVMVRDVDGIRLWSSETEASRLALSPEVRALLLPGKTLTWEVEALAGGSILAASGPVSFVLRPEP